MSRVYTYVGSNEILQMLLLPTHRACVRHQDDIFLWIKDTKQRLSFDQTVIATFIIDITEQLWIADRHSEHVVCATGEDVLAAGEISFTIRGKYIEVSEVTNQSTGYCPEPESWWAVTGALQGLGVPHPVAFTTAFIFRRCDACGMTNIVKDGWFECAVCQASLV